MLTSNSSTQSSFGTTHGNTPNQGLGESGPFVAGWFPLRGTNGRVYGAAPAAQPDGQPGRVPAVLDLGSASFGSCPDSRLWLLRDDGRLVPLPCNSWECEVCGKHRKRVWLARASRAKWTCLWTFSFKADDSRAYQLTRESIRFLRRQRSVFFQWVTRNIGRIRNSASVLEVGEEGGRLHLHVLLELEVYPDSKYADFNKLSRRARKMGHVWIAYAAMQEALKREGLGIGDFKWIDCDRPLAYVASYLGKNLSGQPFPYRCARAVLRGPDVRDIREPSTHEYRVLKPDRVVDALVAVVKGYCCDHGREWTRYYPDDGRDCPCLCHWFVGDAGRRATRAIDLILMKGYHSPGAVLDQESVR